MRSMHTITCTTHTHITISLEESRCLHTFPEPVSASADFIGWAAIHPWVQEYILSTGSQDSAGVSTAQKQSQGPVHNHSRRIQVQINSETMYSQCPSSKISKHIHTHLLLSDMEVTCCGLQNVFSGNCAVSRCDCSQLQLLSPSVCFSVIAVRSFKSTNGKSIAFSCFPPVLTVHLIPWTSKIWVACNVKIRGIDASKYVGDSVSWMKFDSHELRHVVTMLMPLKIIL